MKQYITKEQWNELNPEKKMKFIITLEKKPEIIEYEYTNRSHHPRWGSVLKEIENFRPNIGQMIEFLKDDLDSIENMNDSYLCYNKNRKQIEKRELCNALWETVKFKLK